MEPQGNYAYRAAVAVIRWIYNKLEVGAEGHELVGPLQVQLEPIQLRVSLQGRPPLHYGRGSVRWLPRGDSGGVTAPVVWYSYKWKIEMKAPWMVMALASGLMAQSYAGPRARRCARTTA